MVISNNNNEQETFLVFKQFLSDAYGILLPNDKQHLVIEKLQKVVSTYHLDGLAALIAQLKTMQNPELHAEVMGIVTINETSWCRDTYPFDILKKNILPDIHRKRPMDAVRIWSAAASTGQEPYSISMLIEEVQKMHPTYFVNGVTIVATDISQQVLTQASRGEYDDVVMRRGLPESWRQLFFDELPHHTWRVKSKIKNRVSFKLFNLLDDYTFLGKFDVIFCRNVLVYFPQEVKVDILKRMHAALHPGGYLLVGATEIISGVSEYYQMIQCNPGIIYRAINNH